MSSNTDFTFYLQCGYCIIYDLCSACVMYVRNALCACPLQVQGSEVRSVTMRQTTSYDKLSSQRGREGRKKGKEGCVDERNKAVT